MTIVDFDGALCPHCLEPVLPFETVESIPKASGLVVDQGVTVRQCYRHCGTTWERTVQRPPRWSSSPGPG